MKRTGHNYPHGRRSIAATRLQSHGRRGEALPPGLATRRFFLSARQTRFTFCAQRRLALGHLGSGTSPK